MKLDGRQLAELIGVFTIVVSLLFVGLQLRQANNIAQRESRTEISFQAMELHGVTLEDPTNATLRLKLRNPSPELEEEEAEQAYALANMYANYWGAMNSAIDSGLVPDNVISVYEGTVSLLLDDYPGICPFIKSAFPDSARNTELRFIRFVFTEIDSQGCERWIF